MKSGSITKESCPVFADGCFPKVDDNYKKWCLCLFLAVMLSIISSEITVYHQSIIKHLPLFTNIHSSPQIFEKYSLLIHKLFLHFVILHTFVHHTSADKNASLSINCGIRFKKTNTVSSSFYYFIITYAIHFMTLVNDENLTSHHNSICKQQPIHLKIDYWYWIQSLS